MEAVILVIGEEASIMGLESGLEEIIALRDVTTSEITTMGKGEEKGSFHGLMGRGIKENGMTISLKGRESISGPLEITILEVGPKERRMDLGK